MFVQVHFKHLVYGDLRIGEILEIVKDRVLHVLLEHATSGENNFSVDSQLSAAMAKPHSLHPGAATDAPQACANTFSANRTQRSESRAKPPCRFLQFRRGRKRA
jgi:hypothetical protein